MQLEGKNVLITGATRGLGLALARELAAKGARLLLVGRRAELVDAVLSELRARGAVAYGVAADVGDKDAVHRIVGQAQALLGPVDVVVHNASTLGPVPLALLADTECEEFGRTLETNVLGPFRLTKALVSAMVVRGAGLVVHVSSDAAVEAYPRWGAYGVSKAALDHLARSWSAELRGTGVAVLSVDPGEMDTDMHQAAVPDAERASLLRPDVVAARLVRVIERAEAAESGSRIVLANEEVSS